jgi:phage tail-like protein
MSQLTSTLETAFLPVAMTHHFVVSIDDPVYDLGTWSRASGLQVSWNICEYRVGDQGNKSWVIPGTTKYSNIKLSRAACIDSNDVQMWLAQTSTNPTPLSGAITLVLTTGLIPIVRWRLDEFFPVAWSITDFDADQGKPAIETLEITHGGFLFDDSMPQL